MLVYDNSKSYRQRRRLPVSEHTAALVTGQKAAVRERFPGTPPGRLKLLPSRRLNPDGTRPVTEDNLTGRHRIWVNAAGPLLRGDGTEYDKSLISPYSYRHSYAQRHADAGIGIGVLRELMDHESMDTTKRYYNPRELHQTGEKPQVSRSQGDRNDVPVTLMPALWPGKTRRRSRLLHDPLIRGLASNGKVKIAATRGPGSSWLGSAPQRRHSAGSNT